jgi:hypothetical protein
MNYVIMAKSLAIIVIVYDCRMRIMGSNPNASRTDLAE